MGTVNIGAELTSFTVNWNEFVELRLGVPSSKTRTVTVYVPGPWPSDGVQLIAPPGLQVKFAGPETNSKVKSFAGKSVSAAVALPVHKASSSTLWLAGRLRVGAEFTSRTVSVKLSVSLKTGLPSS